METANTSAQTTAQGLIDGSLATAKKAADDAHTTATLAETVGTAQKTQADTNLARATALLAGLKAQLAPLAATLAVEQWQEAQETAKKVAQQAIETEKQALTAGVTAVRTAALRARDRAVASQAFYTTVATEATAAAAIDQGLVATNAALIVSLGAQLEAAKASVAAEVAGCKGAAYAAAQKLVKEISDQAALDATAADAVKAAYTTASTAPTTGAAGTRCEKSAEGVRPKCADELCCGAAQKILRDGTKLAVETCQAAVGTHTYEYYPPLPAGATVQPSPETWRFQCISGAQKLVAAATAALAASYMMA